MGRLGRVLGMVVVGSVVLVGCGGGDEKVSSSTATTTGAQQSGNDGGGAVGGAGDLDASDCVALATTMAEAYGGVAQAMANLDEGLEDSLTLFEGFADKAPSEIRSDFRVVAAGFAEFVKVMREANFDPAAGQLPTAEAMAKLEDANKTLESSEFTAAAARVSAWFERQCPGS